MDSKRIASLAPVCLLVASSLLVISATQVSAAKIDCHPTDGVNQKVCEQLGCIWSPVHDQQQSSQHTSLPFDDETTGKLLGAIGANMPPKSDVREPWCYFPADYQGYKLLSKQHTDTKLEALLQRVKPSALENDIQTIKVEVQHAGAEGSMVRLRISNADSLRFEPAIPVLNPGEFQLTGEPKYFNFEIDDQNRLRISRRATGAILFEVELEKLIFADQFLQLNSELNSPFLYGLGEHYDTFLKKADSYKAYSFFHTDKLPLPDGRRSYGSFPFYVNIEADKKNAHGVYLHNSDPMDIVLQADQSITFRPIGGIFDFFILSGPSAHEVTQQFQRLVGLPALPPRWSLGFHLCRYNYGNLENTMAVWKRTRDSGIPFDVQWNDIDNMDRHNDFTIDPVKFKGLPEFVDQLHSIGMHYLLLFDPGVSMEDNYLPYTLGEQMDIFIKNASNKTLVGKVWNNSGKTVFPDFSNPKSVDYWTQLFDKFHSELKFDGAWIDMNDISNFVYGSLDGCPADNKLERPPYRPGGYDLQTNTLCLSAQQKAGPQYDTHNLYSFYEAIVTHKALEATQPGKRPLIISRSSSPGQGHFGGHWSGDVLSTWDYLRWSIPSLLEHNMYGYALMGSDICGFNGNTNAQLCARWSTLGAFYTFTRNHNDDTSIDQDPVALGPVVVEANRNALTKKYSLLPFLYSLIHKAHRTGLPAVRSVPFDFYQTDPEALSVEYQFTWGGALMVSPVVFENTYDKKSYLPKGRWYETNVMPTEGEQVRVPKWIDSQGEWYETKNIQLEDIPLFYRGGFILPVYSKVGRTIAETVDQPMSLEIALDENNYASGELYLDDGETDSERHNHVSLEVVNGKLTATLDHDEFYPTVEFGQVTVYGISMPTNEVKVNGRSVSFVRNDHVLVFKLLASVSSRQQLVVEWN